MKILALALALMIPTAGHAAVCAERAPLVKSLKDIHGEVPRIGALGQDGRVFEFIAAPDGTTWTLLLTLPDGKTCVVAVGVAFAVTAPGDPA